ncbi:MAG: Tol-Pal system beta propeller repeat protein TolB [Pseudomonadota bacterium]|nr:Tol-Pal system beta propeller repeat protein TolB [Pseudomonadota bacterium]
MAGFSVSQEKLPTLSVNVTDGVIDPVLIAVPSFVRERSTSKVLASEMAEVVANDLAGTGLFRAIPERSHISRIANFNSPIQFADWRAIKAAILITGAVAANSDGKIEVKFRLWDVVSQKEIGNGIKYDGQIDKWRRISHKVADEVYSRVTGEGAYFDTRIVFVSESGPKNNRKKRLAVMDQDGANRTFLTGDESIVLAPRFSPDSNKILYTSYKSGKPSVYLMDLKTRRVRTFNNIKGMSFAPRFSPDGRKMVLSIMNNGNTDVFSINLSTGRRTRLTDDPAIDTAPSFSPDGKQIVFESDRGGSQQIYVMSAKGGKAKRISFGDGRYATPVWSPRGDLVAFTKIHKGKFHIGVMRLDGSRERLLSTSFLDEGPTWAPNGRVIMFFRETAGASGAPSIYTVDVTGRNLRKLRTASFASDPAWSPLLK